jgi:hypothetical protein
VISENDKELYAKCMEFIKLRIRAINEFLDNTRTTAFHQTNRDFLYLQFRFVFEAISMSALCSHRHEYEQINSKYKKEWNAADIVKAIEKINPQFYPTPENVTTGSEDTFLTIKELIKYHGICGDNLHQYNPYKGFRYVDPSEEKQQFIKWRNKIASLLSCHYIMLANNQIVLRVVMNTLPEGNVTVQEFEVLKNDPMPIILPS